MTSKDKNLVLRRRFHSTHYVSGVMLVRKEELKRVMLGKVEIGGKREKEPNKEAASMVTKVMFLILLASFTTVASTYLGNYQEGQLAKVAASLPAEVAQVVGVVSHLGGDIAAHLASTWAKMQQVEVEVGEVLLQPLDRGMANNDAHQREVFEKAAAENTDSNNSVIDKVSSDKHDAEMAAAEKAVAERAADKKAATVAKKVAAKLEAAKLEDMRLEEEASAARAAAAAAARARNEAAEAAAIRRAEEELEEHLRMEAANAQSDADHRRKQHTADEKLKAVKAAMEGSGARFVSQEEFARLKEASAGVGV